MPERDDPADETPHARAAPVRRRVGVNRPRLLRRTALGLAAVGLGVAAWLGYVVFTTPGLDELRVASTARPSVIQSVDGEVIGRFSSAYQAPVALKDVSPVLVQALIATEDHRFYDHHGLDFRRIGGSALRTLTGNVQGASTLTQQLARNLFPQEIGSSRNVNRKLREALTALRLEATRSKQEILEAYLNTAPFLYNVRGFEMAARTYFDTSAAELDTAQAATLVGMLKGSHRYNPVRHPERARERRNVVLAQMVKRGALTPARCEQLKAEPLQLAFRRPEEGEIGQARHVVEHLREQITEWADAHDVDLDRDGLVIHTTIDSRLQRLAQEAVSEQVAALQRVAGIEWSEARMPAARLKGPPAKQPFAHFWRTQPGLLAEMARDTPAYRAARAAGSDDDAALATVQADAELMARLREDKTRLSAGFIAVDPASRAVRAWVGSPDFGRDQFDHVAQARRQPGSTFKPFVYGAAIARGLSTEQAYIDEPLDIPIGGGRVWRPTDMGGSSGLPMSLRDGLVFSKNTITAQVMSEVGPAAVVKFAKAAGVRQSPLDPVPSLALGTSPVTLLEMATAYTSLANLGAYGELQLITHLTDRNGQVVARFDPPAAEQAIDRNVVVQLVDVMRDVVRRGTASSLRGEFGVRGELAAKTGTSQNNADGWFIAINPQLVAGAWVGFNDQRVALRSSYWGQGAHNALRVVGDFMRRSQADRLIDLSAGFPLVPRPEPEVVEEPASAPQADGVEGSEVTGVVDAPPVVPVLPLSSRDPPGSR